MKVKVLAVLGVLLLLSAPTALAQVCCYADLDCDLDVDGTDAYNFKVQFGFSSCPGLPECDCPAPIISCQYGMIDCGDKCVDPMTDNEYCGVNGECIGGTACGVGEMCISGVCDVPGPTCEGTLSLLGRWCDQGDGTVKDMTTGLVWLKMADWGGNYIFYSSNPDDEDAHYRAARLHNGDAELTDGSRYGDWRLPTRHELVGITKGTEYISSSPSQQYFFTGVLPNFYWSSSVYGFTATDRMCVNMLDGQLWYDDKSTSYDVWPVRTWR